MPESATLRINPAEEGINRMETFGNESKGVMKYQKRGEKKTKQKEKKSVAFTGKSSSESYNIHEPQVSIPTSRGETLVTDEDLPHEEDNRYTLGPVPKKSLDPRQVVNKELKNRKKEVDVELVDDDPRRFAVYKHQTEQDLQYERQKYKHIIDQQKELKHKNDGLNDALKHAEIKLRKVENQRDEMKNQ